MALATSRKPQDKVRFLEGGLARFPLSEIVQSDDEFDLARSGPIPTAGRALDLSGRANSCIVLGFFGCAFFGMGVRGLGG